MLKTKLTNHTKKKDDRGREIPYHQINNFDTEYTARFSDFFQPIGHNFVASFDVLKTAYWLQYEIVTGFDCLVYDTIHLLCKTKTPFTIEILAKKLKVGKDTLRQSLDNLENAELIEIIKVVDDYGQHNCYLLKTPLFERESIEYQKNKKDWIDYNTPINKAVRNRLSNLKAAKQPIPTKFIDTEAPRLLRQVKKNKAKRLRELARSEQFKANHPKFAEHLANSKKDRFMLWKQISRTFGANAATFDEFIYSITPDIAKETTNGGLWAKLRQKVQEWCKLLQIKYDDYWHPQIAQWLFNFYQKKLRLNAAIAAEPEVYRAATIAPEQPDRNYLDEKTQTAKEFLRKILSDRKEKKSLPDAPGFYQLLQRQGFNKTLCNEDIFKIASEFYDSLTMQKITVELRR